VPSGALDDTLVILMGDHGYRFGSFPKTKQGNIENNMPGVVIIPPANLVRFLFLILHVLVQSPARDSSQLKA
jgi:hypothetical protein